MDGYKVKLTCKVCADSYFGASTDPLAREFAQKHQDPHPYKCLICTRKYLTKNAQIKHLSSHHPSDCFFCDICPYAVRRKIYLLNHIKKKHPHLIDKDKENTTGKYEGLRSQLNRQIEVHKLPLPGQEVSSLMSLRNRDVVVHDETTEIFKCDYCTYRAREKKRLTYHVNRYHKGIGVKYSCEEVILISDNLEERIKSRRPPPKMYKCDQCDRSLRGASNLKRHLLTHSGVKSQQCTICQKHFSTRSSLRQHLLTHTGKRHYCCDICGKTFVQKPALTAHRRQHPGKLPPMPKVYIDSFIEKIAPSVISRSSKSSVGVDVKGKGSTSR
ncbi:zinc finger protein 26-like [Fopius arisanus]|uniref:Zinc finger protein 26-like n=1 Tax=Fopius arisanus TaxID=64838 RepID=A0A9R1U377_9HYME|nr:PREDICTED: zinc finger protein 26-like [Fopius arisanus]